MADLDLEQLGRIWTSDADPRDSVDWDQLARRAQRRARFAAWLDYGVAAILISMILCVMIVIGGSRVLIVGSLTILIVSWAQWYQHRLRVLEHLDFEGDNLSMVDRMMTRSEAALKRAVVGLALIGPGTLLGLAMGSAIERTSVRQFLPRQLLGPNTREIVLAIAAIAIVATIFSLVRTILNRRREIGRIGQLQAAYRQEV